MNKIDIKQLLRTNKNTHRIPLLRKITNMNSTLPEENVEIKERKITIFGSKKNIDLKFTKQTDCFVSSSKPVTTVVKLQEASADLSFNQKSITVKFPEFAVQNVGTLSNQDQIIDFGIVNNKNDKLSILSQDNGLSFSIIIGQLRDKYSYEIDLTSSSVINAKISGQNFSLNNENDDMLFSVNNIHLETKDGKISTNYELSIQNGKCIIVPNKAFVDKYLLDEMKLEFNILGNILPIIKMESFMDGKFIQPINNMYLFGRKGRKEYILKIAIKAKEIASELVSQQAENFETLLNLNFDNIHASNFYEGFLVYDGETNNLIKSQNFDSDVNTITIDLTNKIKNVIEAITSGNDAKDIVLEFKYSGEPLSLSTEDLDSEEIADNYVEIYGVYSLNISKRPSITSQFASIGEVKTGTPFLEQEIGRSGKSQVNIFERSLKHSFSLGSISNASFRIPFNMFYDTRLLTQKIKRPAVVGVPSGWMFNLSQYLVKDKTNMNKTKGIKEVLYIDGENNTHVLTEKWFYKDDDGKEVVVTKDDVYLGNDQKLKYKDENDVVHDIDYTVDNDDGLTYFSANSRLNYAKQSDLQLSQKFKVLSSDKKMEFDVTKKENGKVLVPFFKGDIIDTDKSSSSVFPNYASAEEISFKATRIISVKEAYFKDGKAYLSEKDVDMPLTEINIECELLYKNGAYFINGIDTLYEAEFTYGDNVYSVISVDANNDRIELEVDNNVDITSNTDIPDYYEDDNIANVNSQIKQCEDYIKELQSQCETYSNSISTLREQLSKQQELNSINMSSVKYQNEASIIYEEYLNIDNTDDFNVYKQKLDSQRYYSNKYLKESYKYQIANVKKQIDEQSFNLKKIYTKINDYQIQLTNLYEVKESLVKAQKESVQDYIYDKSGNIFGFNYDGNLIYLSDQYENEINISYINNKIVEVSSKSQKIVLHYNDDNLLEYIIDPLGKKTTFVYSSNSLTMSRLDELGNDESTNFKFDDNKLISVTNTYGQSLYYQWDTSGKIARLLNTSTIRTVGINGITKSSEQTLSDYHIISNENRINVINVLKNTIEFYNIDYEGRLVSKTYLDEDNPLKNNVYVYCNYDEKQLFTLDYENKNLITSVKLNNEVSDTIIENIEFRKENPILSNLSNIQMLALSLDFTNLNDAQIRNNRVHFEVRCGDYIKNFVFNNIPKGVLAVPVLLLGKNGVVQTRVEFSKTINLSALKELNIYRANAIVNEYNEDKKLISTLTNTKKCQFSDFDGDNPTTCVVTDQYGFTKKLKILLDANGRKTYEDDGNGNCREIYYDEKGNIVETREYNKSNSSLANVYRAKYDEKGNATEFEGVMRDKNGNYPQKKITYLPGTDIISSIKYPSGQVVSYGYDFNTGLMTEMASDANGQDNSTQFNYFANCLTGLSHHGLKFYYELDYRGRTACVFLAGTKYLTKEYEDNYTDTSVKNGQKITTTLANLFKSITITDKDGDLISTTTNDGDSIVYEYDDRDRLVKVDKNTGEEAVITTYNAEDQIISNEYRYGNIATREDITYDNRGRISTKSETAGDIVLTTSFEYVNYQDDKVKTISLDDTKQRFEYDALGRVIRKELLDGTTPLINESIEYLRYGENSLNLVKEHDVRVGGVISDTTEYEYDVSGNITSIKRDEYETRYKYDELGRLIREDNPILDKTIVYKYDAGGNILLKKEYQYSLDDRLYSPAVFSYTYASNGNKDQLINFNGKTITYDIMGRPTSIGSHRLTWNKKGKLVGYDGVAYTYGMNGVRTSKTINGAKTTYFVLNNKILDEKSNDKEIIYHYSSDTLIGFVLNGVEYIYERNIQGDILKVYRKDTLTLVAEYHYDAYGNHVVINYNDEKIGDINPFRYRGYYFDVESGLYYLNARYYSPAMGRFISPDELSIIDETKSQINGLNLYMYCGDNPIMNADPSGQNWFADLLKGISTFVIGAIVVAAVALVSAFTAGTAVPVLVGAGIGFLTAGTISFVSEGMQCGWDMSKLNYGNVLSSASFGMMGGAFGGAGLSAAQLAGINAGLNFVETFVSGVVSGNDLMKTLFASTIGGLIGGVTGFISGNGALFERSGIVKIGLAYLKKNSFDVFKTIFYRMSGSVLYPTSTIVKSMLKGIPSTFGYSFLNYLYSDMLS